MRPLVRALANTRSGVAFQMNAHMNAHTNAHTNAHKKAAEKYLRGFKVNSCRSGLLLIIHFKLGVNHIFFAAGWLARIRAFARLLACRTGLVHGFAKLH